MSGAEGGGIYDTITPPTPAQVALVMARIVRHHPDLDVQREIAAALGIGGGR